MSQNQQRAVETRLASHETIPARLFACFAEVDRAAGAALNGFYGSGDNLPGDLSDLHKSHLMYT